MVNILESMTLREERCRLLEAVIIEAETQYQCSDIRKVITAIKNAVYLPTAITPFIIEEITSRHFVGDDGSKNLMALLSVWGILVTHLGEKEAEALVDAAAEVLLASAISKTNTYLYDDQTPATESLLTPRTEDEHYIKRLKQTLEFKTLMVYIVFWKLT